MTRVPDVGRALRRYRVMAVVTGSFLLVLTTTTILKYPVGLEDGTFLAAHSAIGIVHGWIYMVYLVVSYMLWSATPWKMPRLLVMALGGVVPLLSFFLERRISREVAASLEP